MFYGNKGVQESMASHKNKGKGRHDRMQLLRKEGPQVQDLPCPERVQHNGPAYQEGAWEPRQEGAQPVFEHDACVPRLREAQEYSEEKKAVLDSPRINFERWITLAVLRNLYTLWQEAWAAIFRES